MAKLRSPNYPQETLEAACERIKRVYDVEHTHPAPKEVVAKDLGYNSINGASLAVIGTLKRYGLLVQDGDNLRVSDDAVTVLVLDEGHPERTAALRRLAFTPKLFEELRAKFGDNLPSDVNLRHFLIQQKKFLPKAADEVIRTYRENLELVAEGEEEYNAGASAENSPKREEKPAMQPSTSNHQGLSVPTPPPASQMGLPLAAGESVLIFKLSRDSEARVVFSGRVTQEAIDKLAALLNLSKDAYPTKAELEQPRSAIWHNKDHDQPVTVTGEAGEHEGRRYVKIEGSETGVPEDELEYQ
jgi:hypothetical protein